MIKNSISRRGFANSLTILSTASFLTDGRTQTMSTSLRTALDIGTSQIRLAVVQVDQMGTSKLLAYGIHDNFGLKNGIIENSEEVRKRVLECISKVEDFYKIQISDVASSLPGITVNGSTNVAGFEKLALTLNNSKTKLSKVFLKNHVAADSVLTAQEKNTGVLVIDI
jgi:cell division ATPase FtsA